MAGRAGRYASRRPKQIRREFLRANRWLLLRTGSLLLVLFAASWLVVWVLLPSLAGVCGGALAVAYCWVMVTAVERSDGTWARRRGAEAEGLTSNALRRLRRRGSFVIDAVSFARFDVDHVVIGSGGVFAIETKWSSAEVSITDGRVEGVYGGDPCASAQERARKIRLLLKSEGIDIRVEPVVVLWGPGVPAFESGYRTVGSATVIEGRALTDRLDLFSGEELSKELIGRCRRVVESFVARRDDYELAHD